MDKSEVDPTSKFGTVHGPCTLNSLDESCRAVEVLLQGPETHETMNATKLFIEQVSEMWWNGTWKTTVVSQRDKSQRGFH
jgi:hypothetical protein